MLHLYSTRTLGLPRKLHMLSLYVPFTNEEVGILFAWGGNDGFQVTLFKGCRYWDSRPLAKWAKSWFYTNSK